jgi:6-pyruvoyltetrahydropterin/6-carboxytetrahydropterin synthase
MRITITKAFEFEACHHLEGYNGDCSRMHGHSYKLEVTVANTTERQLPQSDMVVDFKELSQVVKESVLVDYDHHNLDELFGEEQRATAENMAIDIAARLDEAFEDTTVKVVKIRLYETSTSYVELICE